MNPKHLRLPRLGVHPFAAAGLFFLFCATPRAYAFAVLSSVILHEAGHLIASLLFGRAPQSIRLMPAGISITLPPPRSYKEELTVAAAGPAVSLLWYAVTRYLPSVASEETAGITLILAVLNLLPITGFDGGRICHALISFTASEALADRLLATTTALSLSVLWTLSLYVLFYSGVNVALLFFCACLFFALIAKKL
ncbi:MAG: M50 family metallopeptidase [Clostridia bacterium]|nr:M50 family metallopeptidase [Clostridia bacterium]